MSKKHIIVVRQLGGIGDFIMISPVFRALKAKYPKHQLRLVTSKRFEDGVLLKLADRNPYIDVIHDIDPTEWSTPDTAKWQRFKVERDIREHPLLAKAAQIIDLNTACMQHECRGIENITLSRTQIWCEAAGVEVGNPFPIHNLSSAEKHRAKTHFDERGWHDRPVVGFAPSSRAHSRSLNRTVATEIAWKLHDAGLRPVLVHTPFTLEGLDSVNEDVLTTFALIHAMDGFVSVDSAPLHMAGAMRVPLVGLFGPTDPRFRMEAYYGSALNAKNTVPCAPCWYDLPCTRPGHPVRQYSCMGQIQPSIVVEEIQRLMREKRVLLGVK